MFMKNNSPRFYIILLKKILTWYHFFISFIDWILNLENLYSKSKIKILQDIYIYISFFICCHGHYYFKKKKIELLFFKIFFNDLDIKINKIKKLRKGSFNHFNK